MKTNARHIIVIIAFGALVFLGGCSLFGEKKEASSSSIQLTGKVEKSDLPGLAKITHQQAADAALAAVPGSVLKSELKIEDGGLVYAFKIVGADKKVKEIMIDAGNGKVIPDDDND